MKVSFIGRTNVGKSSLFNCLTRKNISITSDIAGTTRDYQEVSVLINDAQCTFIDTGGFDKNDSFIWNITEKAMEKSNLLLFVVSAKDGLCIDDYDCLNIIRKTSKPVVLIVNKADKDLNKYDLNEFYKLGMGHIIFTSCKGGVGLDDVLDYLYDFAKKLQDGVKNASQGECSSQDGVRSQDKLQSDLQSEILDEPQNHNQKQNSKFNNINPENTQFNDLQNEQSNTASNSHSENEQIDSNKNDNKEIKIAIIGRPNVGKSTILNGILKEERTLTSPVAGTTRDSIHAKFHWKKSDFELIDTAGIRKKSKSGDELELESVKMAKSSIKMADIVFIVLNASIAFDRQDLSLVSLAVEQGKIPILVFNKLDLIKDKEKFLKEVEYRVATTFSQIIGMECIFISAIDAKQKYDRFFSIAKNLYSRSTKKISTAEVNKILKIAQEKHSPPRVASRKLKVKYGLQVSTNPQKFLFFFSDNAQNSSSYKRAVSEYLKFLRNFFADKLELYGIPVFLHSKSSKNPYSKRK